MSDWTVERLDALPLNTMVGRDNGEQGPAWIRGDADHKHYQWWSLLDGFGATSADVLSRLDGKPDVLAIPPSALLSETALIAFAKAQPLPAPYLLDSRGIRAAIAQVTGEA